MVQNDLQIPVSNCVQLKTKRNYNAYRVMIKKSDLGKVFNAEIWPEGLKVREYIWEDKSGRKTNNNNNGQKRYYAKRSGEYSQVKGRERSAVRIREPSAKRESGRYYRETDRYHDDYERYDNRRGSEYYGKRSNRGRSRSRAPYRR